MRKKALIIEDDQNTREYLTDSMQRFGYDVEACSNAEDALRIASRNRFEIVFADHYLGNGKMDGLTFAKHLAEQLPSPPLIILMGGKGVRGLEIGGIIAAFLQKPITYPALKRVLPS